MHGQPQALEQVEVLRHRLHNSHPGWSHHTQPDYLDEFGWEESQVG